MISSESGIVTATAQPSATPGDHTLLVSTLASAGTVYTAPLAAADTSILPSGVTGGDLQLQVGGSGGSTYDIPITPGSNDTLTTLASYINQQSTANNWGVTAAVLNDATGARLAIYSNATGTTGALAITANTTTGVLSTADQASADTSILPSGQQSGDLQLQIGGSSGAVEDIPITAGSNDTLNTLASYINQQSSSNNWGVTAQVVQDSNGYHLTLSSSAQGPAGDLAFTANTTNLTTAANPATSLTFEPPVGGTNANFTVDGIPYSSTTNTVTGAISGVTLNLLSAEPTIPVTLSVGLDSTGITNALTSFVSAYNQVVTDLNQQFAVSTTTGQQGPLGSDASLSLLQSSLLDDVNYSITGNSGLVNLASLGINLNNDGRPEHRQHPTQQRAELQSRSGTKLLSGNCLKRIRQQLQLQPDPAHQPGERIAEYRFVTKPDGADRPDQPDRRLSAAIVDPEAATHAGVQPAERFARGISHPSAVCNAATGNPRVDHVREQQ